MEYIQILAIGILSNDSTNVVISNYYFDVVKYFRENKISLIELAKNTNHSLFADFFNSNEFKSAYQHELNQYTQWKEDFIQIKTIWEDSGIDYVFHKSTGLFPAMSDNLDVLVRQEHFKRAGEVLNEMGYVNLRNIQEAHKEFYRRFSANKVFVPIHLHERVCWSVPFDNIEHLWKNHQTSVIDSDVKFPSYEDCILTNTAHCFLEDHIIKIFDLFSIKQSIESKNIDWEYVFKTAENSYWEHSLYTAFIVFNHLFKSLFGKKLFPEFVIEKSKNYIEQYHWITKKLNNKVLTNPVVMPFHVPHLWIRRHSALRELRDPSFGNKIERYYQVFSGLIDRFFHLKLRIENHPNFFITLSGIDGSGKSSHIVSLQTALRTCDINSKLLWSRAGSTPLISFFLKINRKFKKSKTANIKRLQNLQFGNSKSKLLLWFWRNINVIDLILYYLLKIGLARLFGKVIIADRYIYDSIVDMESLSVSPDYSRFSYKILKLLTPKPDLSIFIDVTPDEVYNRLKDELIKEDLEKEYKTYKIIIPEMKAQLYDNSKPFNEVSELIISDVLFKFFNKYPDKYKNYKVISYRYK